MRRSVCPPGHWREACHSEICNDRSQMCTAGDAADRRSRTDPERRAPRPRTNRPLAADRAVNAKRLAIHFGLDQTSERRLCKPPLVRQWLSASLQRDSAAPGPHDRRMARQANRDGTRQCRTAPHPQSHAIRGNRHQPSTRGSLPGQSGTTLARRQARLRPQANLRSSRWVSAYNQLTHEALSTNVDPLNSAVADLIVLEETTEKKIWQSSMNG